MTVFDDELYDMTSTARELIPDVFDVPQVAQVEEFPYGTGATYRTDIAGVQLEADSLEERADRLGARSAPLNTHWRYLKSYLWIRNHAPISKAAWLDSGRYVRETASECWDWLYRHNFIRPVDDTFGAPFDVVDVPRHGDQYAFELKPRDWEKALLQAQRSVFGWDMDSLALQWEACRTDVIARNRGYPFRHGGYADFAVVIMDADHVDPAIDARDQFEYYGVGLASLDRESLEVHIEPARQSPCPLSRNRLDLNERTLPTDDAGDLATAGGTVTS